MSSAPPDASASGAADAPADGQNATAPAASAYGAGGAMTVVDVESNASFGEEAKTAALASSAPHESVPRSVVVASEAAKAISDRLASLSSRQGAELSWHNVKMSIGSKRILHGVSGSIRPGTLTAIMGPSGAGKTSLLNILAGLTGNSGNVSVSGRITADGVPVDPAKFRRRIAYVMQEDALFATQTPREVLNFSAALRLPGSVSAAERAKVVESIIEVLGLTRCADTVIGNHLVPGISGGEKKRTAIGVELVSSPDILVLDEPTTGLDSFAAFKVVEVLKLLAASGRTVVTTIHQPSSEVFEHFDNVVLLTQGRTVYQDSVAGMVPYFAELGQRMADAGVPGVQPATFVCREHYNPADFIMFLLQQQATEAVIAMAREWSGQVAAASIDAPAKTVPPQAALDIPEEAAGGFFRQLWLLMAREFHSLYRDKRAFRARVGSTFFLTGVVALVFFQSASWKDVDGTSVPSVIAQVNASFGVILQAGIVALFMTAQATIVTFPLERPVFLREYAGHTYSGFAYLLSKTLVEIPTTMFQLTIIQLIMYWLCGIEAPFVDLVLVCTVLGLAASSTSLLLGAVAGTVEAAMQLMPLALVPQLLFAGFFIPIASIPVWLRWAQYLCSLKYGLNLLTLVEFDQIPSSWPSEYAGQEFRYEEAVYGCSGGNLVDGTCSEASQATNAYKSALLPRSEVEVADFWVYVAILLVIAVVFRTLALVALILRAKPANSGSWRDTSEEEEEDAANTGLAAATVSPRKGQVGPTADVEMVAVHKVDGAAETKVDVDGAGAGATAAGAAPASAPAAKNENEWSAMAELTRLSSTDGVDRQAVTMSWKDVTLDVGSKRILHGISGSIQPGKLTAIMGPSGAGKTSLLNILAGTTRTRGNVTVGGRVEANGVQVDPVRFRNRIAYVMQHDALFATQTPREVLNFSAALRLPATVTPNQRRLFVEKIITALGLTKCADTLIGNDLVPGISGGEKKRTAIGVELVSSPDILVLDEPTSGLDSFAAAKVVQILRALAASGRTVVTTIHQPSSEVFELFDNVVLLTQGRTVYQDTVAGLVRYFKDTGGTLADAGVAGVDPAVFTCPPNYNPADFIMYVLQQQPQNVVEALAEQWTRVEAAAAPPLSKLNSGEYAKMVDALNEQQGAGASFGVQFQHLLRRDMINFVRNKPSLRPRFGTTIMMNLLVACVFYQAANWEDVDGSSVPDVIQKVNTQFGVLVQIVIGAMMGFAQPVIFGFPMERSVMLREYAAGAYGVIPYMLSKTVVELPVLVVQSTFMYLITYWLTGLNANFGALVLITALLGSVAAATALVLGAIAESVQAAMQLMPIAFLPQLLFAGFFIPTANIPVWLRWGQYTSCLKYALALVTIEEFHGIPDSWPAAYDGQQFRYQDAVYGCSGASLNDGVCDEAVRGTQTYNVALLPRIETNVDDRVLYVVILLALMVLFRVLATVVLALRARRSR